MALPDLIEIVALNSPVHAEISVPGSKSITNRALILAALANGETALKGALWSEDTQVMTHALKDLGFDIRVEADPEEVCNRNIFVKGQGGSIPKSGTDERPLEIFVGNAGTAARFLAPLVCLGRGVYRLHGIPRMHERPQAALFQALRNLGYEVISKNEKLPAIIRGSGPQSGHCEISVQESSQFASGLILCSGKGGWRISMARKHPYDAPYVVMTSKLMEQFPENGGLFQIEADASSGSYFLAANWLLPCANADSSSAILRPASVSVAHWPNSGWQIDEHFPKVIRGRPALHQGLELHRNQKSDGSHLKTHTVPAQEPLLISREKDLGDSIMTAVVLAPFALAPIQFTDLGRLRVQESERVAALRIELTKCGAKTVETGDTLEVEPSEMHGAEIETYDDHRIAMCFAILGLKVPGIKIKNPSCVKKTFPNFFQKLVTPPPHGLGAQIVDVSTKCVLPVDQLFAD